MNAGLFGAANMSEKAVSIKHVNKRSEEIKAFKQASAMAKMQSDPISEFRVLLDLSVAHFAVGNSTLTIRFQEEALAVARAFPGMVIPCFLGGSVRVCRSNCACRGAPPARETVFFEFLP